MVQDGKEQGQGDRMEGHLVSLGGQHLGHVLRITYGALEVSNWGSILVFHKMMKLFLLTVLSIIEDENPASRCAGDEGEEEKRGDLGRTIIFLEDK